MLLKTEVEKSTIWLLADDTVIGFIEKDSPRWSVYTLQRKIQLQLRQMFGEVVTDWQIREFAIEVLSKCKE